MQICKFPISLRVTRGMVMLENNAAEYRRDPTIRRETKKLDQTQYAAQISASRQVHLLQVGKIQVN